MPYSHHSSIHASRPGDAEPLSMPFETILFTDEQIADLSAMARQDGFDSTADLIVELIAYERDRIEFRDRIMEGFRSTEFADVDERFFSDLDEYISRKCGVPSDEEHQR
ncbi:hypothetical protein CDN99_19120 [Roseateles aquatilis]|uniref:Uncharacterized protein n=1 Tax=Roseateles aquatilis TaxID=431061 RepID=A0A246J2J6_9BURK|nr:hypothetical protein [Roseateles aquatilis]OWQ86830.1 hypothetical protein CDN99_19120 [Roseateles aquatilis]